MLSSDVQLPVTSLLITDPVTSMKGSRAAPPIALRILINLLRLSWSVPLFSICSSSLDCQPVSFRPSARQHDVGSSLLITAGIIWAPAILDQPQCRGGGPSLGPTTASRLLRHRGRPGDPGVSWSCTLAASARASS